MVVGPAWSRLSHLSSMTPKSQPTLQYNTTTCWGSALSHVSMALQMEHSLSRGGACSSGQPKSCTWESTGGTTVCEGEQEQGGEGPWM